MTANRYPYLVSPDPFVRELVARIDRGFPKAAAVMAQAIGMVCGDAERPIRFLRNPASKAAFLVGCCAEEVATLAGNLPSREGRIFLRETIEQLKRHARPLKAKRISPDFRRLVADYRGNPTGMRLKTACYMLRVNGMHQLEEVLIADPVASLSIEVTVVIDGVAGTLLDTMSHPLAGTGAAPAPVRNRTG
ncbi:hypothetical protein [Nitratireductor thuwali]|uniref:Uncharacterized protein n=1 Tax=Nitratireductor thuwali TaxID=2267699 RepID=A0ABY5MK04_9HYPH|nr:hypothetical protein NTH_02814 [Nitratireductor thuwali]